MITTEYNNVWDAIEANSVQTANLKLRSQLMIEISNYVKQASLTQAEAAKRLGTTQPRLNDVLKGKIEKCTVDRLINMLVAIGCKVSMNISHAA